MQMVEKDIRSAENSRFSRRDLLRYTAAATASLFLPGSSTSQREHVAKTPIENTPPYLRDLIPPEVLSEQYRTQIVDYESPDGSDYVRLMLREGAKTQEPFKSLEGSNNTLTICLLGAPVIHPKYLTEAQKPRHPWLETAVTRASEDLTKMSQKRNAAHKEQYESSYTLQQKQLEAKYYQGQISYDVMQVEKLVLEANFRPFLNPTEDDLLLDYLGGTLRYANNKGGLDTFIILPVSEKADQIITYGSQTRVIPGTSSSYARRPAPGQSYLSAESLAPDYTQTTSVATKITPGFSARHELQHASGINNEYQADSESVKQFQEAHNTLKQNADDSKYTLVFLTPEWQYTVTNAPLVPKLDSKDSLW